MAAVSELGRYYAEKIRSVTDLEFYYATHFHGKLQSAYEHLQEAIAHWDKLSAITEEHYNYVPELIRMRVYKFRWRDEGRTLGLDLRRLDDLEAAYRTYDHRVEVIIGHVPALQTAPSRRLPLVVNFSAPRPDAQVEVLYRNDPEKGFKPIKLKRTGEVDWTYAGEIPAEDVIPGILEYYFEASGGFTGHYGSTLDRRATYRVHVTEDQVRPMITASEPPEGIRGSFFPVRVKVSDKNEVAHVWVHYKPIPAAASWLTLEMTAASNGEYEARIPLTPSGILYHFQAVDKVGNATRFPNFLERTPYYLVPPWDASAGASHKPTWRRGLDAVEPTIAGAPDSFVRYESHSVRNAA
jgi:hypothetical protein